MILRTYSGDPSGDAASGQGGWGPEDTPAFWIHRASKCLLRSFDARLRPLGFAMSQLPVLRALADGGALPQKELVRRARVEQATMAESLARMERSGVVERQPNPDDRRGTLVSLTRRSRRRLSRAREALLEADHAALSGFSDAERTLLRELLQRLVRNIEAAPLAVEEGLDP